MIDFNIPRDVLEHCPPDGFILRLPKKETIGELIWYEVKVKYGRVSVDLIRKTNDGKYMRVENLARLVSGCIFDMDRTRKED